MAIVAHRISQSRIFDNFCLVGDEVSEKSHASPGLKNARNWPTQEDRWEVCAAM